MNEPWQCPACKTWIAPGVKEHRCEEPGAGAPARIEPAPLPWIPNPSPYAFQRCSACGAYFQIAHTCWTYVLPNVVPPVTCYCHACMGFYIGHHSCPYVHPMTWGTSPSNTSTGGTALYTNTA